MSIEQPVAASTEVEMEKSLRELEEAITKPEPEKLTGIAQRIATIALGAYTGGLLDRALDISKAIIEFEDTLTHAKTGT